MAIERITCFPNEGTPEVIPGDPQQGDVVRIVGTQNYQRYKEPRQTAIPFNGTGEFLASIKRKADKLARKGDKAGASYLLSKHGL